MIRLGFFILFFTSCIASLSFSQSQHQETVEFTISPNPSNGPVEIVSSKGEIQKVEIVNKEGKIIFTELGSGYQLKLNLSILSAGTYDVVLYSDEGKFVQQLILE